MPQKLPFKRKLLCSLPVIATLGAPTAYAQLEEVVVTAQKREQSAQDVAIAISAFGAEQLQNKGVQDVSDLANLTPNVILDGGTPFSGSSNVLAAYIRGIGQNDFAFNFDPGVGIYVDGVYLARTVGANVTLSDVERVEILKGPQGTLFGRNSVGGAINIVTRDPTTEELIVEGNVTVGSYDRMDLQGFVNLPITDRVAGTVAFLTNNRTGFQERVPYPDIGNYVVDPFTSWTAAGYQSSDTEGAIDEWVVRTKLKFDISDTVTLTLSGDYNNVDSSAIQNTLIKTEPTIPQGGGGVFNWFYNDCIAGIEHGVLCAPGAQNVRGAYDDNGNIVKSSDGRFDGVLVTPFFGVNVDDNPYNDRLPYDDRFVHPDIDKSYATGNSFDDMAAWGLGATLTWDISPTMEFKSITAYRKLDWIAGMDLDGSPLSMLHTSFEMIQDQFSQEFQLNGSAMDGKLNYTTGLYYFTEEGTLDDYVTFPAGFLQVYGPNDLKTDAYAVFANVDYALTDRLELSAGIRYTEEDKEFEGFQHDLNGSSYKLSGLYPVNETNRELLGFPNPGEPLRYFPKGVNEQSFDDVSPRLALRYSLTDDINIYGSWAEGYKTGSWTTRLSSPLSFAPDFGPEEAETWEIGIKGEFLDRKLRVNGAYFFTDYTGIQLNFQEGVSPTFKNAGDAEIQVLDMDITGYFGGGFSFTAGIGLIDAEYTRIDPGAGLPLNNDLPKVPDTQISFGPQYELDLGNGGGLRFNLDYLYQSELENTTENDPELVRPDIDMFNASVTYTAPDGSWDVVLGGTNLTDERYLVTGQAQRAGGQIYGSYNRPREYYLTVRWRN